jgi:recombinational DNA repair ATPase RecF
MVISIILAQCFSIRQIFNGSVILLLDDIFSHLDKNMRQNLLKEIAELDVQVWISSTESVEELNQCKDYIKVSL